MKIAPCAESLLEDLPPRWQGGVAEAQEAQSCFRKDCRRGEEDHLRHNERGHLEEDVAEHDAPSRRAKRLRGLHQLPGAHLQHHRAEDDCQSRPAKYHENRHHKPQFLAEHEYQEDEDRQQRDVRHHVG